jgi:uncharacterized protein YjeT (DUF2065 family)
MSGLLERISRRRAAASSHQDAGARAPAAEPVGSWVATGAWPPAGDSVGAPPAPEAVPAAPAVSAPAAVAEQAPAPPPALTYAATTPDPPRNGVPERPPDPAPELPCEDPPTSEKSESPSFLRRGRARRRIRYLLQLREVQLRDIGGFLVELHRFEKERPELVHKKVAAAARTDAELRALQSALGKQPLRELREPGIGGVCTGCGTINGSGDRHCSGCGKAIDAEGRGQ